MTLARNETRLERNETRLARNETRGGNLHLGGSVGVKKTIATKVRRSEYSDPHSSLRGYKDSWVSDKTPAIGIVN